MKSILTIVLVLVCTYTNAQELAYTPTAQPDPQPSFTSSAYKLRHNTGMKIGVGMMITGGVIIAGACTLWAITAQSDARYSNSPDMVTILVGAGGVSVVGYGALVFFISKAIEKYSRYRFSAFSQNDQVGIAYNFR